jgi:uncharacterized protein (TIGR00369 family)
MTRVDDLRAQDAAAFNAIGVGKLPGYVGVEIVAIGDGSVHARLAVEDHHLAPNGYLHAATIIALADTACGYGCVHNLPAGATGFTTIELKSNFLGTVTSGSIHCEASFVHGGRTTQVWDATVRYEPAPSRCSVARSSCCTPAPPPNGRNTRR